MFYKQRRSAFQSVNFLRSPQLVVKLIGLSSIGKNDLVLEIGPGKGIITSELAKTAGKVIAVEIDTHFASELRTWFRNDTRVEILHSNFFDYKLPRRPFKVFANIPFSQTADIINKLVSDSNFAEGYLIMQKEAAQKLTGKPYDYKNQMQAVLLKPWFNLRVIWEFDRNDFLPVPNVDAVMLHISKRSFPLIPFFQKSLYSNFIIYSFNGAKFSRLSFERILKLFYYFLKSDRQYRKLVSAEADRILQAQKNILKINRTRRDKNWRKY